MVSECGVFVVVTEALDSAVFFGVRLTASELFVLMVDDVCESIVGSVESTVSSSIGIG